MNHSLKSINKILIMCDSYTRFPTFANMVDDGLIPDKYYWKTLRDVYESSDNLYKYKDNLQSFFTRDIPNRHTMMTANELKFINQLPDKITIYRGMTIKEAIGKNYGISWTIDKTIAEFFAFKYCRNIDTADMMKCIQEMVIEKRFIIAYFNPRSEKEIIYIKQ